MQRYLRSDRFGDAAHAAGVLSHYFTDVLQPLHTAICDRERFLHRPIEWSVYRDYDTIYRRWRDDEMRIVIQLSDRSEWLGEAMLHAARFAHRKRRRLLDAYRIDRFHEHPARALTAGCRADLAELFGLAITGVARILERAADDAEVARQRPLPSKGQWIPAVLAGIDMPINRFKGWLVDRRHQRKVECLLDEQRRLGRLHHCLPSEVDIVHRVIAVYHDEQRWRSDRRSGALAGDSPADVAVPRRAA